MIRAYGNVEIERRIQSAEIFLNNFGDPVEIEIVRNRSCEKRIGWNLLNRCPRVSFNRIAVPFNGLNAYIFISLFRFDESSWKYFVLL